MYFNGTRRAMQCSVQVAAMPLLRNKYGKTIGRLYKYLILLILYLRGKWEVCNLSL